MHSILRIQGCLESEWQVYTKDSQDQFCVEKSMGNSLRIGCSLPAEEKKKTKETETKLLKNYKCSDYT